MINPTIKKAFRKIVFPSSYQAHLLLYLVFIVRPFSISMSNMAFIVRFTRPYHMSSGPYHACCSRALVMWLLIMYNLF